MPKILRARAAQEEKEERQLRKLATSRHGPADWIVRARMVVYSWDGMHVDGFAVREKSPPPVGRSLWDAARERANALRCDRLVGFVN